MEDQELTDADSVIDDPERMASIDQAGSDMRLVTAELTTDDRWVSISESAVSILRYW